MTGSWHAHTSSSVCMTILFFISTLKETFPHAVWPPVLFFGSADRELKDVGVLASSILLQTICSPGQYIPSPRWCPYIFLRSLKVGEISALFIFFKRKKETNSGWIKCNYVLARKCFPQLRHENRAAMCGGDFAMHSWAREDDKCWPFQLTMPPCTRVSLWSPSCPGNTIQARQTSNLRWFSCLRLSSAGNTGVSPYFWLSFHFFM